ncbi:preprotein translocase subunit SecE [Vagococcus sp. PNs007]|uniref:Protein translocase subunit SecE n=2 Tax=Vagococcus TaxID=2737 RepID=A0A430A4F7_9ENTE|nr:MULTISPECIES: preprotein translocase subunit SecE [Vagococcus]MDF0480638.1 preprotein translocase subunit SecE [Vagococcus proximus]RSU01592.1 preprotein translocase subunit SecE [Vagococcus fessus]
MKFLKSVREEMKIVTWPSKKQLKKDVSTVIQTTLLFALFFGVVDYGINLIIKLFV